MKKIQLLSIVFSLVIFTGLVGGTAIVYAESRDGNHDFDDRLEQFCEMTDSEKEQLFTDHPRLAQFEERLTSFCNVNEMEREDLIDEFIEENFANYKEQDKLDKDDIMDRYCEMSPEDQAAFLEKHPMKADHMDQMTEYCSLNETERETFIEEHKDTIKDDMREKIDEYCKMSPEDQAAFLEKYPMESDHMDKMESTHKEKLEEYCSLDETERKAFFEKQHAAMEGKMSQQKDMIKDKMCDKVNDSKCLMSDHKDMIKDKMCANVNGTDCKISVHKNSMKTDHKALRASSLTGEQKADIKTMHMELREFKQSMKSNSTGLDKEEIRNQFKEKAKEFSMNWLSPRHQIAAGIDAQKVECRDGFSLLMKTSNAAPICVKESTAEKLIKRGIAVTAF